MISSISELSDKVSVFLRDTFEQSDSVVVFDEHYQDHEVESITYVFMLDQEDFASTYALFKTDADIAKDVEKYGFQLHRAKELLKDKLIVCPYGSKVKDIFSVVEDTEYFKLEVNPVFIEEAKTKKNARAVEKGIVTESVGDAVVKALTIN